MNVGGRATRITYYVAAGGYIVLLTVFAKMRGHEQAEVTRAQRAMATCEAEHAHGEED